MPYITAAIYRDWVPSTANESLNLLPKQADALGPAPTTQTYSGVGGCRLFPEDALIPETFPTYSPTGVKEERDCGCAQRRTPPRPLSAGLHRYSTPTPLTREFPIPQLGFRKETNPLCAPWRQFAPVWGSRFGGNQRR